MNNLGLNNRSQYHQRVYKNNRKPVISNNLIRYNQINRQNFSWWGRGATMLNQYPRQLRPFNRRVSTPFRF
jgi:hypothetical protein